MNNLQPTSNREPWIDFAKGITLLLVIIGHTVSGVLSGAIYSFHMPLFFILSGITAKLSSSAQQFSDKTQFQAPYVSFFSDLYDSNGCLFITSLFKHSAGCLIPSCLLERTHLGWNIFKWRYYFCIWHRGFICRCYLVLSCTFYWKDAF